MNIEVVRKFNISRLDLWKWVTDPEKTELWYGPWSFDKNPGVINITLVMEDGLPTVQSEIKRIEFLEGYDLHVGGDELDWTVSVVTEEDPESEEKSVFKIKHPVDGDEEFLKSIVAGWEFYADCLKAAIEKTEIPVFSDYYTFPEA